VAASKAVVFLTLERILYVPNAKTGVMVVERNAVRQRYQPIKIEIRRETYKD
jgi:hypothetical protein